MYAGVSNMCSYYIYPKFGIYLNGHDHFRILEEWFEFYAIITKILKGKFNILYVFIH